MRRGDVYWVEFPEPARRRPAVLVSRDEAYSVRTRLIVVPLTRTVRGIPTGIRVGPSDGLAKAGLANAAEVVTVPKALLERRITTLTAERLAEVDEARRLALGLT